MVFTSLFFFCFSPLFLLIRLVSGYLFPSGHQFPPTGWPAGLESSELFHTPLLLVALSGGAYGVSNLVAGLWRCVARGVSLQVSFCS
jgi:hypothetical protein